MSSSILAFSTVYECNILSFLQLPLQVCTHATHLVVREATWMKARWMVDEWHKVDRRNKQGVHNSNDAWMVAGRHVRRQRRRAGSTAVGLLQRLFERTQKHLVLLCLIRNRLASQGPRCVRLAVPTSVLVLAMNRTQLDFIAFQTSWRENASHDGLVSVLRLQNFHISLEIEERVALTRATNERCQVGV